jgi:hypothetical protein
MTEENQNTDQGMNVGAGMGAAPQPEEENDALEAAPEVAPVEENKEEGAAM